jgi:hypothetical protein
MKYIFVAGAPGSKWSSVVKNIYNSASLDRSDYSDERTYYHDAGGTMDLMHLGAYFDPGMEFGSFFDRLDQHSREECEAEFDRPFTGTGVRIVKSHVFAHHIDFLRQTWPDCPVVLVYRPNDACLGWWVKCGHFDITYPKYDQYYKNLRTMAGIIADQNRDIRTAWVTQPVGDSTIHDNLGLAEFLEIKPPPASDAQNYLTSGINVKVIK